MLQWWRDIAYYIQGNMATLQFGIHIRISGLDNAPDLG